MLDTNEMATIPSSRFTILQQGPNKTNITKYFRHVIKYFPFKNDIK